MEDLCKICVSAVTLASARLRTSHARTLPCHRLGAHPAPGQQRQDRENGSRHRDRARLSSPSLCPPCNLLGQQALAKRAERREMKAGVRQRQPEEILPVDASPDRVGSLAVSQRLTKLHHSHQYTSLAWHLRTAARAPRAPTTYRRARAPRQAIPNQT